MTGPVMRGTDAQGNLRGFVDSHRYLHAEWKATSELVQHLKLGAPK